MLNNVIKGGSIANSAGPGIVYVPSLLMHPNSSLGVLIAVRVITRATMTTIDATGDMAKTKNAAVGCRPRKLRRR